MARYRLLLVNPRQRYKHYATQPEMCRLIGKSNTISPLSLTVLAALTPKYYEIRIADEELEALPSGYFPDIVGITALTNTITRCYEIADMYRATGAKVVLGGPHVTFSVDEGLAHADSIVVGEAEGAWERCLADFEQGRLQRIYCNETSVPFRTMVRPRWDLVDTSKVISIPVQVSRGCPYNCEFCVVTKMFGRTVRYREIDDVVDEITSLPLRSILFVDDNLTINKRYAWELTQKLKPLGISWTCQASIDIGRDSELLRAMADAGCEHILIGFESLNPASLRSARKYHNRIEEYREAIDRIHDAGIMILASFVVGFDTDTVAEFERLYEFAQQTPLPYMMLNILGAAPGTDLQKRLIEQGRWYGASTDYMGGIFPVMHYARLGQKELYQSYCATVERLYSWGAIRERVTRLFSRGTYVRARRGNNFTFVFRIWMLVKVLWLYIAGPREKRRLLVEVLKLARGSRVSLDWGIGVLVAMEGFNRHLRLLQRYQKDFAPVLAKVDKGPWIKEIHDDKGLP